MENTFGNKVKKWFTVSRFIITFWNCVIFSYHFFFIGFDTQTTIVIQLSALITEYLVSGFYEKWLIWSDKKINEKITGKWVQFKQIIIKYITYTAIFVCVFGSTYYLRLEFFYRIGFDVSPAQFKESIINMFFFTLVAGPIMAILVIKGKKIIAPPV